MARVHCSSPPRLPTRAAPSRQWFRKDSPASGKEAIDLSALRNRPSRTLQPGNFPRPRFSLPIPCLPFSKKGRYVSQKDPRRGLISYFSWMSVLHNARSGRKDHSLLGHPLQLQPPTRIQAPGCALRGVGVGWVALRHRLGAWDGCLCRANDPRVPPCLSMRAGLVRASERASVPWAGGVGPSFAGLAWFT